MVIVFFLLPGVRTDVRGCFICVSGPKSGSAGARAQANESTVVFGRWGGAEQRNRLHISVVCEYGSACSLAIPLFVGQAHEK